MLLVACTAVAEGAKSLMVIGEWAADAPGHVVEFLGFAATAAAQQLEFRAIGYARGLGFEPRL